MRYLIVGGVAGGATVAARLRRLDEKAEITIFEKGEYVSYANCGLPYYIGNVIPERDQLFVQTVEGITSRYDIDIRIKTEVLSINREEKSILVKNLSNGEVVKEHYDKLILSPGAEPLKPPVPGIESNKIFTLRNVPDTDKIKNYIKNNSIRSAIVVGGGFIGLEMAENLRHLGIKTDLVEMAPQVMAQLDYSMASIVHLELEAKGVKLHLGESVEEFRESGSYIEAVLKGGKGIFADMVIWSIGVKPDTVLARESGLELGRTGGIKVNEYLQTSDKDIYALGDAVEVLNLVSGNASLIPLAGPANKMGRIAADNIVLGNTSKYTGSIGTGIAKVFDLTVASAGLSGKALERDGIPHIDSFTHSASHAGYYPNALPLSIKIAFSPGDGRLLGAQVVGFEGVDKRIEMFASVIKSGGTIYDLMELEHAYAPPFSSAKDPVNMSGFVADNILKGRVKIASWREIERLNSETDILIDVRTAEENKVATIPGSVNIPLDELRFRLDEIPDNKRIIVYCAVGMRGYLASRILMQNGFENVFNLSGGYKTYSVATGQPAAIQYFAVKITSGDQIE
ncbi:MAG: CoA-disulfide reductase [Bacteroidetes bacterium 41-46]|jgi:NADPH-dependent 2,4-dienoyl-CoA reductase/sulfur reductase-like enzyme/rhodanese-related sulfurtransferase|nr:MAG: CoA-disulfide reductase [Bacteroidetes bacterium 41-46]